MDIGGGPGDFGPRTPTTSTSTAAEGLYHPAFTYIPREIDISDDIESVPRRRLIDTDPRLAHVHDEFRRTDREVITERRRPRHVKGFGRCLG